MDWKPGIYFFVCGIMKELQQVVRFRDKRSNRTFVELKLPIFFVAVSD
jgi:hypothetical protein